MATWDGLICDECQKMSNILINCAKCPQVVCPLCHDGHTRKGV